MGVAATYEPGKSGYTQKFGHRLRSPNRSNAECYVQINNEAESDPLLHELIPY